ncbi:MAG TPA: exodeoxyribonuclease VII large subunit [Acidimicrobiia bacterium]|nr:exodeoxyribonuclease VII large subunit [Acidimicrobiia bacterium]
MDVDNDIENQENQSVFLDEAFVDVLNADQGSQATFSVREINDAISESIALSFPADVWVRGDVQRLRFHSSGHIYFDLVDSGSKGSSPCTIPVTLLKWNAGKIKGDLREILVEDREIRIRARPDFYAPYGKMSLAASDIDTAYTLGQIALQRRELIAKLTAEGILRSNAEIDLPELCCDIAIVTSVDSAAYHDVVDQLRNSGYGFRIKAINALMQGRDSASSVVAGLKTADSFGADVVLLCRGGGAKSDLATFDSEIVARTIASMDTAVITGLGHQIDVSVADIVAYSMLKTPTACAQFVIERTTDAIEAVVELGHRIDSVVTDLLVMKETRLANISQRLSDVSFVLDRSTEVLTSMNLALSASAKRSFDNARQNLSSLSALISAHDPARVLERGFSLTTDESGTTVRSISQVKSGVKLQTHIADGTIISIAEKTQKDKDKE